MNNVGIANLYSKEYESMVEKIVDGLHIIKHVNTWTQTIKIMHSIYCFNVSTLCNI